MNPDHGTIIIAGNCQIVYDCNPGEALSQRGGQCGQQISMRILAYWDLLYGENFKVRLCQPNLDKISLHSLVFDLELSIDFPNH